MLAGVFVRACFLSQHQGCLYHLISRLQSATCTYNTHNLNSIAGSSQIKESGRCNIVILLTVLLVQRTAGYNKGTSKLHRNQHHMDLNSAGKHICTSAVSVLLFGLLPWLWKISATLNHAKCFKNDMHFPRVLSSKYILNHDKNISNNYGGDIWPGFSGDIWPGFLYFLKLHVIRMVINSNEFL